MSIIRMKKDYQVSYKYNMLLKGNNYQVDKLPPEVRKAVSGLIKSGWAIEIKEVNVVVNAVAENARSKQLEKQKEELKEEIMRQKTTEAQMFEVNASAGRRGRGRSKDVVEETKEE